MTSLLGARKRAEEFAGAVDSTDVTALHPDLRVLVDLTTALRSTPQAQPRTEFTAELRDLLLAEAEQILNPASASLALPLRPRGTRERRMVAVAASVVVFGGTASMAAAAQNALPGQALYPVKRGIEQAQVSLSFTDEGKGRDLLSQANDRLGEVRGLLADGSIGSRPEVTQTLAEFSAQARDGSRLMISAFDENRDQQTIITLRRFASQGLSLLGQIQAGAPASAGPEIAKAATTLRDIDQVARQTCASCAPDLPALTVPKLILASAEADRALRRAEGASLDNSHPAVVDRRLLPPGSVTTGAGSTVQPSGPSTSQPLPGEPQPSGGTGLPGSDQSVKAPKAGLGVLKHPLGTKGSIGGTLGSLGATLLPDPKTPTSDKTKLPKVPKTLQLP